MEELETPLANREEDNAGYLQMPWLQFGKLWVRQLGFYLAFATELFSGETLSLEACPVSSLAMQCLFKVVVGFIKSSNPR